MHGYAEARDALARGDETGGRLVTGDRGWLDADGFLFLTGRTKRFAKLYGLRISLDDIEERLRPMADVAAFEHGDRLVIFTPETERMKGAVVALADELKLPSASFSLRAVPDIPRRGSGKIDYTRLRELV